MRGLDKARPEMLRTPSSENAKDSHSKRVRANATNYTIPPNDFHGKIGEQDSLIDYKNH
jgi:hypothetical protein